MQAIDFSRSFLTFCIDSSEKAPVTVTHKMPVTVNNARIQIDCHLRLVEKATGNNQSYVLGASCKTEHVGICSDIWTSPNADFIPVLSDNHFLVIKTYDRVGQTVPNHPPSRGMQSDRETWLVKDAFTETKIDLVYCNAESLQTTGQVIEATLNNHPLTAITEIETNRYLATLNYPVKTMNASKRDKVFQTDTGPVVLPDLQRDWQKMHEGLELAFSAFNCNEWIEFIVRQPTQIAEGISVWHYSLPRRFECKNQVIRLLQVAQESKIRAIQQKRPHFDKITAGKQLM